MNSHVLEESPDAYHKDKPAIEYQIVRMVSMSLIAQAVVILSLLVEMATA